MSTFEMSHEKEALLKNNIIDISDKEITGDTAWYVRCCLTYLCTVGCPDIEIRITCKGGDARVSFAIYDQLRRYSGMTTGVVEGFAYSGAATLLQGCKKRISYEHSFLWIHGPVLPEVPLHVMENKKLREERMVTAKRDRKTLYTILAKRTKRTVKEIDAQCRLDKIMTAQEALKFGLIDEIV